LPPHISPLGKDHNRSAFESGDTDLDRYLRLFAGQNQFKHLAGVTYVATEGDQSAVVIGYYTLAATNIPYHLIMDVSTLKRLPHMDVPAVLLARLAVTKIHQNQGLGRQLLGDAIRRSLELTTVIGCRCLIVDAYLSAVAWYAKFGFIELSPDPAVPNTRRMVLDLRTAALAVRKAASNLHQM